MQVQSRTYSSAVRIAIITQLLLLHILQPVFQHILQSLLQPSILASIIHTAKKDEKTESSQLINIDFVHLLHCGLQSPGLILSNSTYFLSLYIDFSAGAAGFIKNMPRQDPEWNFGNSKSRLQRDESRVSFFVVFNILQFCPASIH